MKNSYVLLTTIICITFLPGNVINADVPPKLVWGKHLGTPEDDEVKGVAIDKSGNIYVAGHTNGKIGETDYEGQDIFLCKLTNDGEILWTKQFGSSQDEWCQTLAIDKENHLYVGGTTNGELGGQNAGRADAFMIKFNDQGNQIWAHQFGTDKDDGLNFIFVNAEGDVFVTGETRGDLAGTYAGGVYDAFIAKYNSAGELCWMKQYGTSQREKGYGITTDRTGACYLTGSYGFVVKYDKDGNIIWNWTWPSATYNFQSIVVDDSGHVYLGGGDNNTGVGHIIKMEDNESQKQIWRKTYGRPWALYYGIMLVDDGTGDIIGGGCLGPNCTPYSRRYSSDGRLIWAESSIAQQGGSCGNEMITDNKGNFYQIANVTVDVFSKILGKSDGTICKFTSNSETGIKKNETSVRSPSLYQNFPNPFNSSSSITYELKNQTDVALNIYNMNGQKINTLVSQNQAPGVYSVLWNGTDPSGKVMSSGIYFYELTTTYFKEIKKMVLIQ